MLILFEIFYLRFTFFLIVIYELLKVDLSVSDLILSLLLVFFVFITTVARSIIIAVILKNTLQLSCDVDFADFLKLKSVYLADNSFVSCESLVLSLELYDDVSIKY